MRRQPVRRHLGAGPVGRSHRRDARSVRGAVGSGQCVIVCVCTLTNSKSEFSKFCKSAFFQIAHFQTSPNPADDISEPSAKDLIELDRVYEKMCSDEKFEPYDNLENMDDSLEDFDDLENDDVEPVQEKQWYRTDKELERTYCMFYRFCK